MARETSEGATGVRTDRDRHTGGWRARILASIIGPVAWICFTLLYVGFWASGFSLFQSVIVILVSLILLGGVMGALWTTWGPRYRGDWY
jgi:hypothetical protein